MKLFYYFFAAIFMLVGTAIAENDTDYDFMKSLDAIEKANTISPQMQKNFESGQRLKPGQLEEAKKRMLSIGIRPQGYCCHNNGECTCNGLIDCGFMLTSNTCSTDEDDVIVCTDESCTCSEAGTQCPFENCCTTH